MATKDNKPAAKKTTGQTKVTRITAKDTASVTKKSVANKPTTAPTTKTIKSAKSGPSLLRKLASPFINLGVYFKGAWYELNQVTWPNRKATLSLTLALIIFTAFFAVMILLLDVLFKYLLELILG